MKIPQRQKRMLRRVLQTLKLEGVLRTIYRLIVRTRLRLRYGQQNTVELEFRGAKVKFSTDDLYSKRQFLTLQDETYEEPVTELLTERMCHARAFVDVGANLGYYTCIASKLMPEGQVYAFEMDDDNLELLGKNVRLNNTNNVRIIRGAVTNSSSPVQYIKDTAKASVGFGLTKHPEKDQVHGNLVSVDGIVLDEYFQDSPAPDLYKIDVEGAELMVLQGMQRLLSAPHVEIFVEVHPDRILNFDANVSEVITLLIDHGFTIREVPKSAKDAKAIKYVGRETVLRENNLLYATKS